MEIEIRRDWLTILPRLASLAAVLMVLTLLTGLGYVASPRTADGRPVLLLPDVRAVEIYRRQAVTWLQAWQVLDMALGQSLSAADTTGLLDRSRQAQSDFASAIDLARTVDGTEAPPALLGLHDQTAATAQAYVDATVALNRWLSAPSSDNRAAADQAYRAARDNLTQLAANAWLKQEDK